MFIKNNKNSTIGFTLLEMSIVVLILGILLVGGINLHLSIVELSEKNLSSDRIYVVDKAIREYVLKNLHLPCPSNILLSETDDNYEENFGKELRDNVDGECYVPRTDEGKSLKHDDYIAGGVPTKVLGLPSEYAEDAWGNRIVYVVDKKYAGSKIGFFASGGASINIKGTKDENDKVVTNRAIYVLISSGQNGNGAFRDGIQNDINADLDDAKNIITTTVSTSYNPLDPSNSSSSTNHNPVFIKDINNKNFDDIVYYRDKNSLIFELDLEDSPCSMNELHNVIDSNYPNSNVNCNHDFCFQGTEVYSIDKCGDKMISENPNIDTKEQNYKPSRRCQKYGQWSNIMYECTRGCGRANIDTLTDASKGFPNPGDLLNSIEVKYLYRVRADDTITLDCKGQSGYIILKCEDNGDNLYWTIQEANCIDTDSGKVQ